MVYLYLPESSADADGTLRGHHVLDPAHPMYFCKTQGIYNSSVWSGPTYINVLCRSIRRLTDCARCVRILCWLLHKIIVISWTWELFSRTCPYFRHFTDGHEILVRIVISLSVTSFFLIVASQAVHIVMYQMGRSGCMGITRRSSFSYTLNIRVNSNKELRTLLPVEVINDFWLLNYNFSWAFKDGRFWHRWGISA